MMALLRLHLRQSIRQVRQQFHNFVQRRLYPFGSIQTAGSDPLCVRALKANAPPPWRLIHRWRYMRHVKKKIVPCKEEQEEFNRLLDDLLGGAWRAWRVYGCVAIVLCYKLWYANPIHTVLSGNSIPPHCAGYIPEFAPCAESQIRKATLRENGFALLCGSNGAGKKELAIQLGANLRKEGFGVLFLHVSSDLPPLQQMAQYLNLSCNSVVSYLKLFRFLKSKKTVVIFDVQADSTFDPRRFRKVVKSLAADERLIHCLIVASEGMLFQTLSYDLRLRTFVATELEVEDERGVRIKMRRAR